ncbi:MAG: hypothetical protein NTY93_00780 [Candidatus Kaiserbacteria bacterium]|nr:hypothetical protein [Candidatus Kaiserbacteria bacterium]
MDTNTTTSNTASPVELPKKYIRTFAGDMATVKKGGTPDLEPLAESKPASTPSERLVAASPIQPTQIPSSNVGHVSSSPLSIPVSKIEPQVVPTVPAPVPETPPPPLETYASDFSDRMKETRASAATVLAAEQDAAPHIDQPAPNSSRGGFLYIFAGIILLIAGGVGAYIAYTHYSSSAQPEPVILASVVPAPIFVDEREQIFGTGATLLSAIEQSITRPLAPNTVRLLYTENATSTDNSVFSALQVPAPNILLRNLNASDSMAGIVNAGGNQSPFFILSVVSYSDTFSGMLSWEPLMPHDFGTLFPPIIPASSTPALVSTTTSAFATTTVVTATTTKVASTTTPKIAAKIATTTTATSSIPIFIAGFHDEVINNHDVRVYRDTANKSVLLYGYWNQTTLVVARDPAAFSEIVLRLASARAQ